MIGRLPETLEVGGVAYPIRSDYRNVLQVFEAFEDPELTQNEKWQVAIYNIFADFSCSDDLEEAVLEGFDADEAADQIAWFISAGEKSRKEKQLPVYNWIKDEQMIFSAVNKVCGGREVRNDQYIHWWTFLGYFNEIGEGMFAFIVNIRDKINKNKKLEKHEQEFYDRNKDLVDMEPPMTKEERQQFEEDEAFWNEVIGW